MAENYSLKSRLNTHGIREKGMLRFIIEVGILRFGFPATVLGKIIIYLLGYGWKMPNLGEVFNERNIYYFFAQVLTEGITFGLIVWFWGKQEDSPKLNQ